jgi:SWI/SNF-related matrix-associated actin-dependent regulator of chromatin subfamily A3
LKTLLTSCSFIKDPLTVVSRAASYLEAERRLCLTGTPIQNKVEDVWALLKFLRLKPFDDKSVWQTYVMSLAKAGNSLGVVRLQTILRHCTLRRTKDTVSADGQRLLNLPPRVDQLISVDLTPDERAIYDAHFSRTKSNFEDMQKKKGDITYVNILQQILRLRQICDHWTLVNDASAEDVEEEIMGELDTDIARQTILQEGLNLRRAFAYVNSLADCATDLEEAARCASCQASTKPPKEEEDDDEERDKGRKRKAKSNGPILTRCCHLFCKFTLSNRSALADFFQVKLVSSAMSVPPGQPALSVPAGSVQPARLVFVWEPMS